MRNDTTLAYDLNLSDNMQAVLAESNDDRCLEQMREIIKSHVAECVSKASNTASRLSYKQQFEKLRDKVVNPFLKEYSSFEFMEKLYMQEHIAKS